MIFVGATRIAVCLRSSASGDTNILAICQGLERGPLCTDGRMITGCGMGSPFGRWAMGGVKLTLSTCHRELGRLARSMLKIGVKIKSWVERIRERRGRETEVKVEYRVVWTRSRDQTAEVQQKFSTSNGKGRNEKGAEQGQKKNRRGIRYVRRENSNKHERKETIKGIETVLERCSTDQRLDNSREWQQSMNTTTARQKQEKKTTRKEKNQTCEKNKTAKESTKQCRRYAPERVYSAKTGNARAKGEVENKKQDTKDTKYAICTHLECLEKRVYKSKQE